MSWTTESMRYLFDAYDEMERELYALLSMAVGVPAAGGVFEGAAGSHVTITSSPEYHFYRNTAIQEQYNLVCDYLSSLDTRPWWAEKLY